MKAIFLPVEKGVRNMNREKTRMNSVIINEN